MGQIIIPNQNRANGPWLLDQKNLEELHETLIIIENKLEDAFNHSIDKAIASKIEDYQAEEIEINIEKVKRTIKDSYPFKESNKYVLVTTKQGKKIKEEDIIPLLKERQIEEFNPTELTILIKKGPFEFTLEVSTEHNGELETRIKALDDYIFNEINYEIGKWIAKYKPNIVVQKWSEWFPFLILPIFIAILFGISIFFENTSEIYKKLLYNESYSILEDGLVQDEINKATEILLQLETNYVPEKFNPSNSFNKIIDNNIWIFAVLGLTILCIAPRTIIGLGKESWKVIFYKFWIYAILFFIPTMIILPIILNKFT